MLKKALILCGILLSLAPNSWAIDSYPGEGSPILGALVTATGGDVIATFVSGSGFYDDYLYLDSPSNPSKNSVPSLIGANWIFQNHLSSPGNTVDLGVFAAGTELIFNVLADTHGRDFSQNSSGILNWYTGPASRNADGFVHAFVDAAYTGPFGGTLVGFEDLAGLGDAGYEDLRYTFSNVTASSPTSTPEPGTFVLLATGFLVPLGVGWWRRQRELRSSSVPACGLR